MLVDEFDDFLIADVVGDEMNVLRNTFRCVVFMLQEGESGPLGMFFPKFENGFGSLQRASPSEVENGVLAMGNFWVVEIAGSEPGEMAGGVDLAKDFQSVFAFAEDVIDFFEPGDMALRKPLLIWDEEIESG